MQGILNNLIEKMDQNIANSHNEENTYIKDELKYCKVCNQPLEVIINHPITGEVRKVNCICKCKVNKMKEEEEVRRNIEKIREIEKLQKQSLLGERYRNVKFENTFTGTNNSFDTAFKRCKNYCEVSSKVLEEGYGIYIFGDKGTGKTHLTACMVNELVSQRRPVLFTNFFEISKLIRGSYNKSNETEADFINKISTVDFLFIDDIGSEIFKKNDEDSWLQGIVFDVINKRYNNKKPTVFTSNHSLQELISQRGLMSKTVDRILEMSNLILKIEGKSYRMEARKNQIPF